MMKRWKILAALLVIFLSGTVVGSVITGMYIKRKIATVMRRGPGPAMQRFFLEKLSHELDLSSDQEEKIEEILHQTGGELRVLHRQTRPKAHAILDKAVSRVKEHLSAEQSKELEEIVQKMKRHRGGFFRKGRAMSRAERQELVERILSAMTQRVALTPEQNAQIRPVLDEMIETRYRMIQMAAKRGPRRGQRTMMTKKPGMDRDFESKLAEILSREQMQDFWKFKAELRTMMRDELLGRAQ